jgi:hypothetical protein
VLSRIARRKLVGAVAGFAMAACTAAVLAQSVPTKPLTPSQEVAPDILMNRIDVTCDVMTSQTKLIKPVHLIYASSTWKVASDADVEVAQRSGAQVVLVDVWKQDGKYVWVASHTFNQTGDQRATQLCFRNDGTLARVRQATTVPALDVADATRAYYNTDGSVIAKFGVYAVDDPAIGKAISSLPYYKLLP